MSDKKTDTDTTEQYDDLGSLTWLDTYRMPVLHPRTGETMYCKDGSEMWIDLLGSESDEIEALKARFREENRRLQRKSKDLTPEREDAREIEILVTATKDWNLQFDGNKLPCTPANAKMLYKLKTPMGVDLKRQVSVAVFSEVNFMGESMIA
ncbi:MAG: hypothetical protein VBE63_15365 [Lamprobacter sp.]|uniref:hypothetical protein n=1 Tax=Lamprobacter sp. TaxID=3100796 RepID=UPI002B261CF5|nr:hypothetical protein [Lamprobacter sp.]MEA3641303.1 hypothetical protein [Lamprobacter sp.]